MNLLKPNPLQGKEEFFVIFVPDDKKRFGRYNILRQFSNKKDAANYSYAINMDNIVYFQNNNIEIPKIRDLISNEMVIVFSIKGNSEISRRISSL